MSNYREQIAQLRAERLRTQQMQAVEDYKYLESVWHETTNNAQTNLLSGDREAAHECDEYAESLEQQMRELAPKLPPPQISARKQEWIARRADLASNPVNVRNADAVHRYLTEHMNIEDDSDTYYELMSAACEPVNYQPMVSPDEVCEMVGIDAKTYNAGVNRLARLKASGGHQ
jgi:hypothetical protein